MGQWYLVCGCMTIRRCVTYGNDLRGTLTDKSSHGLWPGELKTIIWPRGQRSRSHEGHYHMWHTALWSCTHLPNIFDLSRKTKMLWPRQENTIQKTIIWPWGQSSRSHEGHYGPQGQIIVFLNSIYLVCGCITIRRCVAYRNDLCGTLTFDLKVK
jgi:hypothetical protein